MSGFTKSESEMISQNSGFPLVNMPSPEKFFENLGLTNPERDYIFIVNICSLYFGSG